jgi:hypothetical protein
MKYQKYIVGLLAIVIAAFIVVYWNDRKHWYAVEVDQRDFKNSLDTLRAHDRLRDSQDSLAQEKYMADSIRLYSLEGNVAKIPDVIHSIQNRYDAKRKHIDTISADEQLQLFSDWLSKEDSTRR